MSACTTRRAFLKKLAGGLGLAAPCFLTGKALAAPGRPAASDRVRVGHIGVGIQGSYHVLRYAQLDAAAA